MPTYMYTFNRLTVSFYLVFQERGNFKLCITIGEFLLFTPTFFNISQGSQNEWIVYQKCWLHTLNNVALVFELESIILETILLTFRSLFLHLFRANYIYPPFSQEKCNGLGGGKRIKWREIFCTKLYRYMYNFYSPAAIIYTLLDSLKKRQSIAVVH